jgi:hydrogenase nickel incorporation protein HypB
MTQIEEVAMEIKVLQDILESNKEMAREIEELLKENKIYMIDVMSSPGSGKTTITDSVINSLKNKYRIGVIEGDISTTKERLAKHDIPIVQIETSRYLGDCHLESSWIMKCLNKFDLKSLDFIIIENVGNLVCPAEFQLGDDERIVVLSITEGEDKPVKYPLMFTTSQTMIINKMDLLPHLNFNMEELKENIRKINSNLKLFYMSATNGEGVDEFIMHLDKNIEAKIKS